jgi:hypothetical protein
LRIVVADCLFPIASMGNRRRIEISIGRRCKGMEETHRHACNPLIFLSSFSVTLSSGRRVIESHHSGFFACVHFYACIYLFVCFPTLHFAIEDCPMSDSQSHRPNDEIVLVFDFKFKIEFLSETKTFKTRGATDRHRRNSDNIVPKVLPE